MPGLGGLEVQQRLQELGAELPIIFLTAHGDVATCAKAFRSGAFDFLEKPVDDEVLLARVQRALARNTQERRRADFLSRVGGLTPREKAVFELLIIGRSLKEIASALDITVQTVWRHRDSVLRKMNTANDVELARLATRCGYGNG
jgi:FixJ family two-component response regulator